MTEKRANTIYNSIMAYSSSDDLIIELKTFGFSVNEATRIIKKYKEKTGEYLHNNLYYFKKIIDFNRLDYLYTNHYDSESLVRKKECLLETMKRMSDTTGDIYYFKEEIYSSLKIYFKLILTEEEYDQILEELYASGLIMIVE